MGKKKDPKTGQSGTSMVPHAGGWIQRHFTATRTALAFSSSFLPSQSLPWPGISAAGVGRAFSGEADVTAMFLETLAPPCSCPAFGC